MELGGGDGCGGGGGFWELSSAFSAAPPLFSSFNQHDAMMLHGSGLQGMPLMDPHLTCLKLGKRHYFEDGGERTQDQLLGGKKAKAPFGGPSVAGPVPRCQVEGCNMVLIHAKDYHRRHKVCEMHSKAPKVVVLGLEQRFCQQCSRFHVISEFDDSKRSCRRRLAGHNERRRKSSNDSIGKINPCQDHTAATGRHRCMPSSPEGAGALSLLSSAASYTSDLSRRSSAALRELIAENRAAALARQFTSDHHSCPHPFFSTSQVHDQAPRWSSHFHEHVTLDLMQTPASSSYAPLVHGGGRRKEDDECCDIWKSFEGAHVDIC